MIKSTLSLLLPFGFALIMAVFAPAQSTNLSGEQIVAKMAQQYANAKSYQDEGIVRTVSDSPVAKIEEINAFKTYFARPTKLRFEWEDKATEYLPTAWHIVWSDGKDTFTYWEPDPVEKERDLGMGIAGATGVSRGSAQRIPTLLVMEIGGFRVTEMKRISLIREEQFEGENCFVVRGFHPFGFPIDLWISKNDFLIRKTSEHNDEGRFREEDIRRNVKLNRTIADDMFHYAPPKPAAKKNLREVACAPSIVLPIALILANYIFQKSTSQN